MEIIDISTKFDAGYLLTLLTIIAPYVDFAVMYQLFRSYSRGDPLRRLLLPGLRDRAIITLPDTMDILDLNEIFGYSSNLTKRCTMIIENNFHIMDFSNIFISAFKFNRMSLHEFTLNLSSIVTLDLSYVNILDDDIFVLNSLTNLRNLTIEHCELFENKNNLKLNLEKLDLKCITFVASTEKQFISFEFLTSLKNLRELCFIQSTTETYELNDYTSEPFEKMAKTKLRKFPFLTKILIDLPIEHEKLTLISDLLLKCPRLNYIYFYVYNTELNYITTLCSQIIKRKNLKYFEIRFGTESTLSKEVIDFLTTLDETKFSYSYSYRCTYCHP